MTMHLFNVREGRNLVERELHSQIAMREPISADWISHQLFEMSSALYRSNFKVFASTFRYLSTYDNIFRQKSH